MPSFFLNFVKLFLFLIFNFFFWNFYEDVDFYIKFDCESDYLLPCICGLVHITNNKVS